MTDKWERVGDVESNTWRLSIPGGWLYSAAGSAAMAMVFVPLSEVVKDHRYSLEERDAV
jgi:hypothetical protein